jgi:uncharacterized iron-regulated membrane protein
MPEPRRRFRKALSWSHRWLGFIAGVFFCTLAATGGLVAFRPQIASQLSPVAPSDVTCVSVVDWNRAEREIEQFAGSKINRIYAPTAPDTRYRFRMMTDEDAIFGHVIYDGCSAKVLGTASLGWMDWMVDFHHNLRAGRTGRIWGGWIGVALLASGIGGLLIWLLSNPNLRRLLRIRSSALMPRDLHALFGVSAGCLLIIGSFTGLWLCFPQPMRAVLNVFAPLPADVRLPRPAKPAGDPALAGLGDIIACAQRAIPDGEWREIRMPEGYGNVQVRMRRQGDFRSLGNNVVTVDRSSAVAIATDLYSAKSPANHFVQAMAGLHYGEWGGLTFRSIYGLSGLVSALLFATGILLWWLPKRRAAAATAMVAETTPAEEPVSIL